MTPHAGRCEGDTVVRRATPEEGGYRLLTTDCSVLGLTCGLDESDELTCIEAPEPSPLSCVGHCGDPVRDPVSGDVCFCDDDCVEWNDCCDDKAEVCPVAQAEEPEPVPPTR